jgi:PKD repeat protein
LSQPIEILPQPVASFTVPKTTGAAPFIVSFENTSTDASQYLWDFAGLDTSSAVSPTFTFEEEGTFPVQLSVANAIGCADTFLRTFTVVKPVFDMSLDNITLQPVANGNNSTNIILTVSNSGTLPVQGFYAEVKVDHQLAVERSFGSVIEPGATLNFPLGVAFSDINNSEQNTRYICATLTPLEDNFVETEKDDNIFCLNLEESFFSLPPFPNPVQGLLQISLILPDAEGVNVVMATVNGDILQNYTFPDVQAGLNTLQLDVSTFPTGVYLLQIRYQGRPNAYRVVVNP